MFTSLTRPVEHLDLDLNSLNTTLVKATPVPGYDASLYVSEQTWITAPDGERVPVSLLRRRDTLLPAPTLLYGYGSYGFSMDPAFSITRLPLVDRGWVYAIAHVRGGSELGRRWYDAGRLAHKMNTFTDFVAAGEALKADGTARTGRHGPQRGRPPDGRGAEPAPRPVDRRVPRRAVRGCAEHHARRQHPADHERVRRVGNPTTRRSTP